MAHHEHEAKRLERNWEADARWSGIRRGYTGEQVLRLRNSF